MTAPAQPGKRGQRVGGKRVEALLDSWLSSCHDHDVTRVLLDYRDARATITRLTAENEALHSAKQISDAAATYWEDETRKARAALATAKRDGWIAGRDAAAACARSDDWQAQWEGQRTNFAVAAAIHALEPPEFFAADVGSPEPAKTEGGV